MPEIEIYTQPWCPYCERAMGILTARGVAYREISAPQGTPAREESVRRSGGRTSVPQIFIGGTHVGGCDDLVLLQRTGKLDAMLESA
jgi:glutaredoxin 3